ncbi:mycothione reductase [Streptomyces sp. AJS327]|uniref:mycothione reductase n=1 Tax=Streptomyces sp. AJS327 TaxID=2545265 RepID=UPI0015E01752|nr:mycothione reductase [Streptomyces sp. AJS327]MBA0052349.1 mycothione reductase [Streptomyces sp. AJS327]
MRHFDLAVIGSGSGNSMIDQRFADWDIAFVEKGVGPIGSFGGTCLNVGCIPTKMLTHTAEVAEAPERGARLGVDLESRGVRWREIRDRIFDRIDPLGARSERSRARSRHITVYRGTGRFTGVREITVDLEAPHESGERGADTGGGSTTFTADRVVVAAGSRPAVPDLPGLPGSGYLTSDTVMRLDTLPPRVIILGAGSVGLEFAHVLSGLGVRVTLVNRSDCLLRREDRDVCERFTALAAERWDVRLNREAVSVERDGELTRLRVSGPDGEETLEAEALLLAVGRVPNSDLVDAEAGGLDLTGDGRISVDATQATSVAGVWALGDVSSTYWLKHVANHEARVVAHNLLHPEAPVESDHRFVPHAVFTTPQVASVGLTEQQALREGLACAVAVQRYADIAYGWAMEDTSGFAKLLADPATGRLLGAHIMGPEASSLLQPLIQAMHFGQDVRDLARGQYWIHPALPELVENALLKLDLPARPG